MAYSDFNNHQSMGVLSSEPLLKRNGNTCIFVLDVSCDVKVTNTVLIGTCMPGLSIFK